MNSLSDQLQFNDIFITITCFHAFKVIIQSSQLGTIGSARSFLVNNIPPSRKSYRDMYSICSCCLNVATNNWKVHNGKVETHFLSKPPLSSYVCKSVYDVDIAVFVESSIAGSLGQMRSTQSPNVDLFGEMLSSI